LERQALNLMPLDIKCKNIAPPPRKGSKYLLKWLGISLSNSDNN
jgi:hypothetical protein